MSVVTSKIYLHSGVHCCHPALLDRTEPGIGEGKYQSHAGFSVTLDIYLGLRNSKSQQHSTEY